MRTMQLRAPRTYASRIILIFNPYISSKKKPRQYFTFVRNQDNVHPFPKKILNLRLQIHTYRREQK